MWLIDWLCTKSSGQKNFEKKIDKIENSLHKKLCRV